MAEKLGRSPAGDEAGPHGDTSVADRLVLEFLAYLELEGDVMGALGNDDVFALGRVGLAQDRVDRLIYRATEMLAGAIGPTEGDQEFAFEAAEENGVDEGFYYSAPAPEGTWLYGLREAEVYVMEASDESDEDDATTTCGDQDRAEILAGPDRRSPGASARNGPQSRMKPAPKAIPGVEVRHRQTRTGDDYAVYRVRYRDAAGNRRSREFDSPDDALDFRAQVRLLRRQGDLSALDAGTDRLADFAAEWWELSAGISRSRRSTPTRASGTCTSTPGWDISSCARSRR